MGCVLVCLFFTFFALTLCPQASLPYVAYTTSIWFIFFAFSGTFVLMPTVTEKVFGSKYYSGKYIKLSYIIEREILSYALK